MMRPPWIFCAAALVATLVAREPGSWAEPGFDSAVRLDVTAMVRKVQERYDATQDLLADVEQETRMAKFGKTLRARGTVVFKKPGKMRWEMQDGMAETIVANGVTLWIYRPEDQQAIRMPFSQAFRSTTPISFLTGVGRISEDFEVQLGGQEDSLVTLVLTPKRKDADLGTLRLFVQGDTFDIVGAEVTDPLGNVSRLKLSNVRRNTGVSDETFAFQVPAGVDVLDAPASP